MNNAHRKSTLHFSSFRDFVLSALVVALKVKW